ncbi:MAG: hypothetical protein V4560_11690 [Bacteroidota bacterium]
MITKEYFLSGKPFLYDGFAYVFVGSDLMGITKGHVYCCGNLNSIDGKVYPCKLFMICSVDAITNEYFSFYTFIFGFHAQSITTFDKCLLYDKPQEDRATLESDPSA